jgi:hypothetical protein
MLRVLLFSCLFLPLFSAYAGAQDNPRVYARLVSNESDEVFRAMIPEVMDDTINDILKDPRLIFYTKAEVPRAYQIWNNVSAGVFDPRYNISGNADRTGNANEFPWRDPFGTHLSPKGSANRHVPGGVRSFKALWLPPQDNGLPTPAVFWRARLRRPRFMGGRHPVGYRWIYPLGTRFFEFMTVRSPQGADYIWSIRMRHRVATGENTQKWEADVFVPFLKPADLIDAVVELKDPSKDPALAANLQKLEKGETLVWGRGLRNAHATTLLNENTAIDNLPRLGEDHDALVANMLQTRMYTSAKENIWRKINDKPEGYNDPSQPSTQETFHVVPFQYTGAYVSYNAESCLKCHGTANTAVDFYDTPGRDWYGQVPGGDTIFSMHPFARQSISGRGSNIPVSMNQRMLQMGIFEPHNQNRHPSSIYRVVNNRE